MNNYQRTYGTARSVSTVLEIIAWILVILGISLMAFGFASGFVDDAYSFGKSPTTMVRFLSTLPGVALSISGLFIIASAQFVQATVDTAEMTRDLLELAEKREKRDRKILADSRPS